MSSKTIQTAHDAAVLPRIRELEAEGLGLRQIAEQLQAEGFTTPRPGKQWNHIAVKRILERAAARAPTPEDTVTLSGPVTVTANGVTLSGPVTIHGTTHVNGTAPEPEAGRGRIIDHVDTPTLLALAPPPGRSPCPLPPASGESVYELIQSCLFRRRV